MLTVSSGFEATKTQSADGEMRELVVALELVPAASLAQMSKQSVLCLQMIIISSRVCTVDWGHGSDTSPACDPGCG